MYGPGKCQTLKCTAVLATLHGYKKKNPHMMIALCGCMMQEAKSSRKDQKELPFCRPDFWYTQYLSNLQNFWCRSIENQNDGRGCLERYRPDRGDSCRWSGNIRFKIRCQYHVWLQQFLQLLHRSLCTRTGAKPRARKRSSGRLKNWWQMALWKSCFLGQNVNSYGKNLEQPITFAQLLEQVEQIEGLERIRFMTSHPKDLSDELIAVMAESKKICRHLHLPLQSGSSRLLKNDEPPL